LPSIEPDHDADTRQIHKDQDLPECWLIAQWPTGSAEPTRYWLCTLPKSTRKTRLVQACKQRWRVEHDYRELKTGLGLDHYEGRKWAGWHHHVTPGLRRPCDTRFPEHYPRDG
jgi:SRSO17 transposase